MNAWRSTPDCSSQTMAFTAHGRVSYNETRVPPARSAPSNRTPPFALFGLLNVYSVEMGHRKAGTCCLCGTIGVITWIMLFPGFCFLSRGQSISLRFRHAVIATGDIRRTRNTSAPSCSVAQPFDHPLGRQLWETSVRRSLTDVPSTNGFDQV